MNLSEAVEVKLPAMARWMKLVLAVPEWAKAGGDWKSDRSFSPDGKVARLTPGAVLVVCEACGRRRSPPVVSLNVVLPGGRLLRGVVKHEGADWARAMRQTAGRLLSLRPEDRIVEVCRSCATLLRRREAEARAGLQRLPALINEDLARLDGLRPRETWTPQGESLLAGQGMVRAGGRADNRGTARKLLILVSQDRRRRLDRTVDRCRREAESLESLIASLQAISPIADLVPEVRPEFIAARQALARLTDAERADLFTQWATSLRREVPPPAPAQITLDAYLADPSIGTAWVNPHTGSVLVGPADLVVTRSTDLVGLTPYLARRLLGLSGDGLYEAVATAVFCHKADPHPASRVLWEDRLDRWLGLNAK